MYYVQQPRSVELAPISRLRSTRATGADGFRSNLSFVFFFWTSECIMQRPTSLVLHKALRQVSMTPGPRKKCSYARPEVSGGVGLRTLSGNPGNSRGPR